MFTEKELNQFSAKIKTDTNFKEKVDEVYSLLKENNEKMKKEFVDNTKKKLN